MYRYLQGTFDQGDHVAIIGPTGTGKTHMALAIAELRDWVLVVACKPEDPLIEDARAKGYWLIPGNKLEIPYAEGRPVHNRVIYWPRLGREHARRLHAHELLRTEKALQKPLVGGAIGYVRSKKHWCLVIDEGTWVCRDLGLQRDVDSALFQFRALRASVVVLGQRPSWMGRYVLSSPSHLFIFNTNDTNDRKALGEISGVDTKLVQELVRTLDFQTHEALYINTKSREMFVTVAPPR
jgi:energy-coupling factor transporter ATP-binding protein EcfA2